MFVKLKTPLMMVDLEGGWVCSARQCGGRQLLQHTPNKLSQRGEKQQKLQSNVLLQVDHWEIKLASKLCSALQAQKSAFKINYTS